MLTQPLRWKKPRKIFVCSMTDLFADFVTDEMLDKIFAVMALTPQHTYQVLTKRAARMRDIGTAIGRCRTSGSASRPSASRKPTNAIPLLLETPAAVRFISAEPLLGPIDLHPLGCGTNALTSSTGPNLDWVIAGGESGPHARPMHPDWARSLRDQCQDAGVAFFFKQWGEWAHNEFPRVPA
jgi:protein gp37